MLLEELVDAVSDVFEPLWLAGVAADAIGGADLAPGAIATSEDKGGEPADLFSVAEGCGVADLGPDCVVAIAKDSPDRRVEGHDVVALVGVAGSEVGGETLEFVSMLEHEGDPLQCTAMLACSTVNEVRDVVSGFERDRGERVELGMVEAVKESLACRIARLVQEFDTGLEASPHDIVPEVDEAEAQRLVVNGALVERAEAGEGMEDRDASQGVNLLPVCGREGAEQERVRHSRDEDVVPEVLDLVVPERAAEELGEPLAEDLERLLCQVTLEGGGEVVAEVAEGLVCADRVEGVGLAMDHDGHGGVGDRGDVLGLGDVDIHVVELEDVNLEL